MVLSFPYTPKLGWSISRFDTFKMCKRQYYYQYYGKFDREFDLLRINTLKGLTSVPLEIGNIAHEVIKTLLERLQVTAKPIDRDRFLSYTDKETLRISTGKNFSEVYYKEIDSIEPREAILPRVHLALTNLLDHERLEWLMKEAITEKDDWVIEPDGYGECRIDGQKAYCKVDFLFPVGREIHIYDWKTGKRDDKKHGKQMRGYVTWAHYHYGIDYDRIKPTVAYLLPEYKERSIQIDQDDIEVFADRIREESEEMYEFCEDVEENVPRPKEVFQMTDNLKICAWCNYRELCGREDVRPSAPEEIPF
ncbi:MAG: PD-(D/E)XK nuclease family protein [Acidobacteria bacterium]|nr:MAG: PD-(D/E)XK nuclease family protein [Acidobacteriota bacterium]REK02802.1 MAG: PD-(D/E)XK nuclease family protein [Acidobacteriota bacterium]REK13394.1 MAG: PD-(D/E)XK nuclease family protein [Acidobacteriota bacterium]REK41388.1 MAG: PD-(D/E)XK nuclease family protein [Acidobacteriota bacterium]